MQSGSSNLIFMNKKVVLFLTSPSSIKRSEMSLKNFKQLKKLGYDIITLSTNDFLPDYICENSKMIIYDYNKSICDKKQYQKYYKSTGGNGYFFWFQNSEHKVVFFHKTNFPSVVRNTRTLVHIANSFDYDKYFFVEDDHFFHDDDLKIIHKYFEKLDTDDLIVFTFDRNGSKGDNVYCSYFHFGVSSALNEIVRKFAYTNDEFIKSNPHLYFHFYEHIFKCLIHNNKPKNLKILEISDPILQVFKKSSINIVYSYMNLDDDCRCNFLYDVNNNNYIFYYHTNGLDSIVNLKIFVDNKLHENKNISPSCWYITNISAELINDTKVILNDKIVKNFKNLNINDIIYNGEFII